MIMISMDEFSAKYFRRLIRGPYSYETPMNVPKGGMM